MNNGARVAKESKVAGPGPGHNGWMMVCAALVLFMTLPGLALFYGGMVRTKNVLSVMAQCLAMAGLVTILWLVIGYSLVFAPGTPLLGGTKFAMFAGVGRHAQRRLRAVGFAKRVRDVPAHVRDHHARADRRRNRGAHEIQCADVCSTLAWMFLVYFPLAHMVWGGRRHDEWRLERQSVDQSHRFRGRNRGPHVFWLVGDRARADRRQAPRLRQGKLRSTQPGFDHGRTGMLWVGWYGFIAGSAVAADTIASNAFVTTTIAAAVACVAWPAAECSRAASPRCSASAPVRSVAWS